jgi:ATP-binding cassette subfamily B protein
MLDWKRWRDSWLFFAELPRAGRTLAAAWWVLVMSRGVLPALFAVATGALVAAIQRGAGLPLALATVGGLFIAVQVIAPLQGVVGTSLGERLMARLNDRLLAVAVGPSGLGHLENPGLADDVTAARDFELGLSGPPMPLALEFTATGLIDFFAGLAQTVVLAAYSWWACLLVAAGWLSTHLLLRTATVWDRETGDALAAQRRADYSYRLATGPPAAKEVRLFGLSEWVVERFAGARRRLVDARWSAARMPRRRVVVTCALVVPANVVVLLSLARSAVSGQLTPGAAVTFIQAAVGASGLALGGTNWALPHVAHAVANVRRLEPRMREQGRLADGAAPCVRVPRRALHRAR